ncbi:hypothetical protein PN462_16965 [Spirulina sp. CS-785/01]|uniref:glutamine amidotransferase-related protein n=1 Tax=Spirulina sp. CS-785/01 TaxID=3021716 RepID=UPI00232B78DB|nr:hypothetical protein [Spirulina sp. CS-785/01]MDB9314807.1 hypothetical protein [Spirulina sp. CS-785/01]
MTQSENTVLAIVHQETSDPGRIGQLLQHKGYRVQRLCPALGESLPENVADYRGVVVFGGPMSANDEHLPFIRAELDWMGRVIASDTPLLGICLGAQLLARVLGAEVFSHPEGQTEIGYYPIEGVTEEFQMPDWVYQWHQEGFELPRDTVQLARGETFVNQAFRYETKTYGIQFHPEVTEQIVDRWTTVGAEMLALPGAQPRHEQQEKYSRHQKEGEQWLSGFLENWLEG